MIENKKIVAVVPARGGSKGILRKNIVLVAGKPLIAYTIDSARQSRYLDRIVVSSEDEEILGIAKALNVDVIVRPHELALDETPGIEPILHAIDCLPCYDYIMCLQTTSPLRQATDIDGAIEHCFAEKSKSCVSVCVASETPYWMYTISATSRLLPVTNGPAPTRRQDCPTVYKLNGAIYMAEVNWLKISRQFITEETSAYIMSDVNSIDIDNHDDLKYLESVMRD